MSESRFSYRMFADAEQMADAGYSICRTLLAIDNHDRPITLVLSGGSTPIPLFQRLAEDEEIDWSRIQVFWGDERCVPPDHEQSNYRSAYEHLLKHVDIPEENIHRMEGELPPAEAAQRYEDEIRRVLELEPGELPRFDLVMLGMGDDGHTASLFPGTAALNEEHKLVVANDVPQMDTTRITLTFPVLNAARQVIFLVGGTGKGEQLERVLFGPEDELPPAGLVQPESGSIIWLFTDQNVEPAEAEEPAQDES